MSGFYAQDLTKKDTYLELVGDCFDTMDKMGGAKVAFLPLGGCGNDWATDRAKRAVITKRLHEIGEAAKARGKRVGIDTPLDAKGNLKLLRARRLWELLLVLRRENLRDRSILSRFDAVSSEET